MAPVPSFGINEAIVTSMLMIKLTNVIQLPDFIRHLTNLKYFSFYVYFLGKKMKFGFE